jgi:thiamine pyrophosphate-dependent acetolactate synthase large subunit-like protein
MGCLRLRVEQPAEIRGAIERALAPNRPAVVEVVTGLSYQAIPAWLPAE